MIPTPAFQTRMLVCVRGWAGMGGWVGGSADVVALVLD